MATEQMPPEGWVEVPVNCYTCHGLGTVQHLDWPKERDCDQCYGTGVEFAWIPKDKEVGNLMWSHSLPLRERGGDGIERA